MFTFPHSGNYQISNRRFLAAWKVWFDRFQPGGDPRVDPMPRLAAKQSLSAQLKENKHFSLDVLCRMLTLPSHRSTMQASSLLMAGNAAILDPVGAVLNPATGRLVQGAKLTAHARRLLDEYLDFCRSVGSAEALIESDIEVYDATEEDQASKADQIVLEALNQTCTSTLFNAPQGDLATRADLVKLLVNWINREPFQPRYRGGPYGGSVTGWNDRLQSYFWPNPNSGYQVTAANLAPMLQTAADLVGRVGEWDANDQAASINFANKVFEWGGVPQRAFTWQDVKAVFETARTRKNEHGARMNSGWTKVAAFATASLFHPEPLVIWDSRVAHSLISRIEAILIKNGINAIPAYLANIGVVSGRGGTRNNATYTLDWPNGYGRWDTVFAGSELVAEICNELNARKTLCLSPDGQPIPWDVRSVEMVLFMDGY